MIGSEIGLEIDLIEGLEGVYLAIYIIIGLGIGSVEGIIKFKLIKRYSLIYIKI